MPSFLNQRQQCVGAYFYRLLLGGKWTSEKVRQNIHWELKSMHWENFFFCIIQFAKFVEEFNLRHIIKTNHGYELVLYFASLVLVITVNPLYNDTRYKDKICYDDNLTGTKPSLKRGQLLDIMSVHYIMIQRYVKKKKKKKKKKLISFPLVWRFCNPLHGSGEGVIAEKH